MIWKLPSAEILPSAKYNPRDQVEIERIGHILADKLDELGCRCEMERVISGPQITRYELVPRQGLSVRKIPVLADDIAFELAVESVRVLAPIPGKRAIGVEIPTPTRETVMLRDVMHVAEAPMTVALGVDADSNVISADIRSMPHLLIGGMTGAGKSMGINAMICSLLMCSTPDELGLVLIDPKMVEFAPYEGLPHLMMPVVKDARHAEETLGWLVQEMEDRYRFCEHYGVRNLEELNRALPVGERFPYLMCVVDELADLIMVARKEVEAHIIRIGQKARAVGIHLILATQSPRVGVCTGLIKSNMPARIAYTTAQALDSRVIIDQNGAETLLGNGDMLYKAGDTGTAVRIQGPFVSTDDVNRVCDHWRSQIEEVAA